MQKAKPLKKVRPPQHQRRPGKESKMRPAPVSEEKKSHGSGKLNDKVAVITGGDSGIGKAVAILFAKEGADIAVIYLNEHEDAKEVKKTVEEYGRRCLLIPGDVGKESFCRKAISRVIKTFKRVDTLVNNAAIHYEEKKPERITTEHLRKTFEINVFSMFWLTRFTLPYMKEGSTIINTTSVTAYRGSGGLIDYASTKGAIVSLTRSLSANLIGRGIRVNGVAPGPIWTPLIVSSFPGKKVAKFGTDVPMGHAGEPVEIAPSFLFLACDDSSYMTGQILHPNGGEIVNG